MPLRQLLCALFLSLALIPGVLAAQSSVSGRIVFTCETGGLCAMNADGTDFVYLTSGRALDTQPSWSPDNDRIVFVRESRQIIVIDADGSNEGVLFQGAEGDQVGSPTWSSDAGRIAFSVGTGENSVLAFMNADGSGLEYWTEPEQITTPDWSPDGTRIVMICAMTRLCLYDLETRSTDILFNMPNQLLSSPDWSPDGTKITFHAYGQVRRIYVYEPATGEMTRLTQGPEDNEPNWSPDGQWIVFSRFEEDVLKLFRVAVDGSQEIEMRRAYSHYPDWSNPSSSASEAPVTALPQTARRFPRFIPLLQMDVGPQQPTSVDWSPDGSQIVVGSMGAQVSVWNLSTRTLAWRGDFCNAPISAVDWSPDGRYIACSGLNMSVEIIDAASGASLGIIPLLENMPQIWNLAFSPDGSRLAIASNPVIILESGTWLFAGILNGHSGNVWDVAWSGDGLTLASSGLDGAIILWDVPSNSSYRLLETNTMPWALAFSPKDTFLAWGTGLRSDMQNSAKVWDTVGNSSVALQGISSAVQTFAWTDTLFLALALSEDPTIHIVDAATGAEAATLSGHTNPVAEIRWSSDYTRLASVGADNDLIIWGEPGTDVIPNASVAAPQGETATPAPQGAVTPLPRACTVSVDERVNARKGAGTQFAVMRSVEPELAEPVVAQTRAPDGYTWWQLFDGYWVRDDVVTTDGDCAAVPFTPN